MTDSNAMDAPASDDVGVGVGTGGGLRVVVDPAGGVVVGMSDVLQNEAALYPAVYAYIAGCGAAIIDQVNAR